MGMTEQHFRNVLGEAVRENSPSLRTKGIESILKHIGVMLFAIWLALLPVGIIAGEVVVAQVVWAYWKYREHDESRPTVNPINPIPFNTLPKE